MVYSVSSGFSITITLGRAVPVAAEYAHFRVGTSTASLSTIILSFCRSRAQVSTNFVCHPARSVAESQDPEMRLKSGFSGLRAAFSKNLRHLRKLFCLLILPNGQRQLIVKK